MSNRDRRVKAAAPPENGEARVQLSLRVKRELYDRARSIAKQRGYLSVAEWARSVVLAAIEK